MDELTRFFEFEQRLFERLSTRTVPFDHGVGYVDEDYPERYYSSFLLVERVAEGTARVLDEAAGCILGGAGCRHRQVIVRDERAGERLAPAFEALGYATSWNVAMVHRRAPDREPHLAVEQLSFSDVEPVIYQMYRDEPGHSDEAAGRLTDQHGKFERVLGALFFAARVEGQLAGDCELYLSGPDAQVENVGTVEQFRGRGVARSVVLRAVEKAKEAGARRVFIVADQDDRVKDLYERLGFDQIGRTWQFLRPPGQG